MRRTWLWLFFTIVLAGTCYAGQDVDLASQPVDISSRRLEVDEQAKTATFSGDVIARQGDVTLYSDMLILVLGEKEALEKLNAVDNVRIVRGDEVATANRADYDLKRQEIILQGNAKIHRGDNSLSGEQIMIDLTTRRSVVTTDAEGRVRAQFRPQQGGE